MDSSTPAPPAPLNTELVSHDGPGHQWLASRSAAGIKLGLDRTHALLRRLGDPQHATPSVIVAGTNGKGSTSAMIAALLEQAGLRVGHFTSPHLVETRERFRLGGRCVAAEALDDALVAVRDAAGDDLEVTPFEALSAAGFVLFREADITVLEVGLGGRLDATNVTEPLVAVVTQIARDHTRVLGDTLAEIAREKVAVARPGRPLVVSQPAVTIGAARRLGLDCPVRKVGTDAVISDAKVGGKRLLTSGVLSGPGVGVPLHVEVALHGLHQLDNAAAAVLAYQEVRAAWPSPLPEPVEVAWVLAELPWPARLEVVSTEPLVVLDGAHNPAGMRALANTLKSRSDRWHVLLSVRDNRDAEALVRELGPVAESFWLPRMVSERLQDAHALARVVDACASHANTAVGGAAACLREAKREAHRSAGVVLTGSLYGIGEWLGAGVIRSPRLERWVGGS